MTEKDLDSMATVQMKPEYAPSEVYSTASEPPPAYKRKTSSVQIAKIVAFTVIVSSFIIGSFILASAYLQAKTSCDQIQALDSVLEKELMLETLQQELPRAEALLGKENDDAVDLQNLEHEESIKKDKETKLDTSVNKNEKDEAETDSSFSDSDETDDLQKVQMKVPLELDLSDLAAALLQNNQKSRMNCVIERKHAEEYVDTPAKTVNLPFGVNLSTDPKKAKITGERISIFCDGGDSRERTNNDEEDAEQIRPMFIPIQRIPIPYGPTPQQVPLTHMPQHMMPQHMMPTQYQPPQYQSPQYQSQMLHKMAPPPPPPFQQMPQQHMQPPQVMQAPHPEPQVRIQVQRIPIREIHIPAQSFRQLPFPIREMASSLSSQQSQSNEVPSPVSQPQFHVQRVPLGEALQRAGITADDLRNIQRMAEDRITEELRHLAAEEAAAASAESENTHNNSSEMEDSESDSHSGELTQQLQSKPQQPDETMRPPMPDQPQILQMGRASYGRSLPIPVRIPVPMMQALADEISRDDATDSERPHYVHPRSVRSVKNPFTPEKRVKRCACDCAC